MSYDRCMRDQRTAGTSQPTSDALADRQPASAHANEQSGLTAVHRIASLGPAELAAALTTAPAAGIGELLDGEQVHGTLARTIRGLDAAQSQRALQPALRAIKDEPLTALRKATLGSIFDGTPDGFNITLMLCFEVRFGLQRVGLMRGEGAIWDTQGLRRTWATLSALPEAHVDRRPELAAMVRDPKEEGGVYKGDRNEIALPAAARHSEIYSDPTDVGHDPLDRLNWFDSTVRHEVGHSVDARIHASSGYCTTPAGGSWAVYETEVALLRALYREVGLTEPPDIGALPLDAAVPLDDDSTPAAREPRTAAPVHSLEASAWHALLVYAQKGQRAAADHFAQTHAHTAIGRGFTEVLRLLAAGRKDGEHEPWNLAHGGAMQHGGRTFFHDKEGASWASYATSARERKVSEYQFRSPFEWFAEAYSAYYDPASKPKGALLASRDPATKQWFDAHVDTLTSTTGTSSGKPAKS